MSAYYLFFIDVINSCKTEEQLQSAEDWISSLFRQANIRKYDRDTEVAKGIPLIRALNEKKYELGLKRLESYRPKTSH